MNKKQSSLRKNSVFTLVLFIFFGLSQSAIAGPLTDKCNRQTSQGPEGVVSRINCFRDEYLRLLELKQKIKMMIGFGNGIRGKLATGEQKQYQCRSPIRMTTYKVPKNASGGRCSNLKNQHSDLYNSYYKLYCQQGFPSTSTDMKALHAKVVSANTAYKNCFDDSVKLLVPSNIRRGDPDSVTGHSSFNNRKTFVNALNQLRNRWKDNNYQQETKLLARSCNDLLTYAESKYPQEIRNYNLHCQ